MKATQACSAKRHSPAKLCVRATATTSMHQTLMSTYVNSSSPHLPQAYQTRSCEVFDRPLFPDGRLLLRHDSIKTHLATRSPIQESLNAARQSIRPSRQHFRAAHTMPWAVLAPDPRPDRELYPEVVGPCAQGELQPCTSLAARRASESTVGCNHGHGIQHLVLRSF